MNTLSIAHQSPDLQDRAECLSRQLALPLQASDQPDGPVLMVTAERLELRQSGPKAPGPVYVDFAGGRLGYRGRQSSLRNEPLARAAGLKKGHRPQVVDATAGLGRDAFILAGLGCQVILLERHPVIAALLADGLTRAGKVAALAPIIERMTLISGDGVQWLSGQQADVVCLDPMYPHRDKQALVKKEMRVFRTLVGDDQDAAALLEAALGAARERVVVKRPARGEFLGGRSPSHSLPGSSTRFDIYLPYPFT
ncbi:16S rRNA (guanine1516-N2)-methyltransferase [Ectothiorhodospira magna]|uniref:Ribosomal RNA small subunit methyltransferase J n=1 Tax=Ectothiorhodospira magna TaxID=867345 RepID=A0A1H9E354_9GAMM|nr:class I SAM-dependent methyltransferase [Ectothiorhodospira magna]SEQ20186.1 16S rRNA (guanine1516-N2)-methyltransferase [Ectothiorhodospira magna]